MKDRRELGDCRKQQNDSPLSALTEIAILFFSPCKKARCHLHIQDAINRLRMQAILLTCIKLILPYSPLENKNFLYVYY